MDLKARNKDIKMVLADPLGAALFNYYKHGELKSEGSSITEGIGQGRITANLEGAIIDEAFQIHDPEAVQIAFDLLQYEGLCMGGSTGINVGGASAGAWTLKYVRANADSASRQVCLQMAGAGAIPASPPREKVIVCIAAPSWSKQQRGSIRPFRGSGPH